MILLPPPASPVSLGAAIFIGAGEELTALGAEEQVMTKTAWVFPGKGPRQWNGNGFIELSAAKDKFAQAEAFGLVCA